MYKRTRNGFSLLLAAIMFISAVSGIALALPLNETSDYEIKLMDNVSVQAQTVGEKNCIDTEEKSSYADDEKVTFIIEFEDEPLLETSGTVKTTESGMRILTEKGINLRNSMLEKQNAAVSKISSACENGAEIKLLYNYSAAFNGVAIEAPYGLLDTIKNTDGVKNAHVSPVFDAPKTESKELNPQMATAGDMMGASAAWDSGYDGEGTLIAIIDTGLYTDHEAFQTAPEKLKYSKSDIQNILNENQLQAEKRVSDISADSVYLRDKIPFAFDYANGDCDVNHGREAASNDHGTHVAGIAAADAQKNVDLEGAENMCVKGAAPKAQLAIMKVFGDNGGGAQWANIVAAMEDTIYLGADSVNISIGEVYSFPTLDETYAKMFDLMHENGINVSVSAGNYYNSAYASTWGTGMNTTLNLENSMLTSPSIYRENLCVASVNNTSAYCTDYISVNGYQMTYCDSALDVGGRADLLFNKAFGGQTLEYVVIDGYGEPNDYENIDINGKIALVQRGGIIFPEKQLNAYNAGAAGFILYDNVVQPPLIQMNIADPLIPSIAIRRLSGLKMVEEAENGVGKVYIAPGNPTVTEAGDGYEPSDFSSWGPLSDLTIKPEISAPGGNIISTVDYYLGGNNKANYASYSGTSMAAPGATGCMAVIRQRVNELFPNMTPKEKANVVYALAMSTAVPSEHDGTPYGVRKQGAGVINAANAVKTNAYITVDGQDHPKIELGDDASRSGVYKLSFNVVNFGNTKLEYDIEPILTVPGYSYVDQGYRATYVQTDYNKNCTDMMSFTSNMPNNRVTVEAGQTVNVEVTMSVNDEFRELMSDVFKYGSYVEGYCRLNAVGTGEGELYPNLSVCYLGYYGSWCECPVVDSGFYYDEPQNDLSCMTSPNTAGSKINMLSYMELGMNPYFEDDESFSFLADRCSISPANEDGMYDAVDYFLTGIVRNLSKFYYRIYDPQTNEVYFEKVTEGDFPKNDDRLATGSLNPMGTSTNKLKTWRGENQAEGQTLMIRCGGEGLGVEWDEAKAPMSHWEIPVTVDNTAPYIVESHSEGTKLFVTVSDAHYAAYAGVFENEDDENPFAAFCISENERGAKTTVEIDMQGREKAYLLLGDYACNEAQYEIKHTSGGESPLPSDSVEPIPSDAPVIDGVYYQQAAQLTDGEVYIIAATDNGYHALTTNSTPNGIAGAKTNVTIEQGVNVISGFATNAIEWKYESGKLVNVQTGEKLEVGDDGILKLTDVGTQWTYSGTKLISGNYAMAYNGWFDANSDGSVINIFRKVANIKDAQAIMGVNIRRAGNKLFADITFETEQPVTSGVITSSYDSDMLTLTDVHNGDMMNGVLVQVNSQLNDKVLITYAGADTFEADGSIMFSVEFELKETAVAGTVLLFELAANETILDDTTTMIKVDVSGAVYTVEGEVEPSAVPTGSPTVTPTNPEPTDSPTSTPTVTATLTPTAEPTYIPTDTPTNVPTEQPTVTPTQTVTVAPTTAPTSMPTANPTVAPTPMVPPETGDRMGLASLCFAIFGLSAISYTVVRRREYADDEQ